MVDRLVGLRTLAGWVRVLPLVLVLSVAGCGGDGDDKSNATANGSGSSAENPHGANGSNSSDPNSSDSNANGSGETNSSGGVVHQGTLHVGVILPMTGAHATYGEESWNGLLLAEDDLKAAGLPMKLKMIRRDEKSTPQEARTQAKVLIENDGVDVLIGSVASSNTKGIFLVAREAEVPCISPASTNDKLTIDGGPYTSRICFKDSFQGSVLAKFALSQGWKKVAIACDKAQDYSIGLKDNFIPVFKKGGGEVTEAYFTSEDTDFSNVIQSVASASPDAIFISGYYEQAGPMIKQSKGKWDGKPIFGGDGLDSPNLVQLVGDTKADIYLSSHFAANAPIKQVQDFAKRYKNRFGEAPGAMAALGYDVLLVLVDAVKRCSDPKDPEQLAKSIAATTGVTGITGTIKMNTPDRTPIKDAVIVKVDGGLKFFKSIPADD